MFENIQRTKQFQTSPEAEAKGEFMAGWTTHVLAEYTQPKLEKNGIAELKFDEWYPYQTFLDISREIIEENENVMEILVSVGKSAATSLPTGDFESMQAFKEFIESIHGVAVRNAPTSEGLLLKEVEGQYYLINNTPNSNDLFYGWCWEFLNKHKIGSLNYNLSPHQDYPSNEIGSIFLLEQF